MKLKPFFIFCSNNDSAVLYNKINDMPQFKNKEVYFSINKNGWMIKNIMKLYIETIYLDYVFDIAISQNNESILILDNVFMHLIKDDFSPFIKHNINEAYIQEA